MNRQLIQRFANLIDMQSDGRDLIGDLPLLSPSLDDGYCLCNLYSEWKQAISSDSPRREALELIKDEIQIPDHRDPPCLGFLFIQIGITPEYPWSSIGCEAATAPLRDGFSSRPT